MSERRSTGAGGREEPPRLSDALGEVVAGLAAAGSMAEACTHLADFAVGHLGADVAGIVRHGGRGAPELLAASDPVIAGLEAAIRPATRLRPGETVRLDEIGAAALAEAWRTAAPRTGLRAGLLVGLPSHSRGDVHLALYTRTPAPFSARALEAVTQTAILAGSALREAERRLNLEQALHSRSVIGQAQGVLMVRFGLTGGQAMAYLRRQSQATQQPIRDLATEVVEGQEADSTRRDRDGD